jgi:CBS domain containing-hemolysin-like protein
VIAFAAAMFLAAAETSLLRVRSVRVASLAAEGDKRARTLGALLDRLRTVLSAILLAALLSQIGAATVVGVLAGRWFGGLGVTIASVVLTVLLFVYAEAIPKTYAVRHADRTALTLSGPIRVVEIVLRPIVAALIWFADLQMPGRGIETSPTVTEDELRRLATHAADEGTITKSDRHLIERAFRFGDRQVDDIMVPRPDIVAAPAKSSVADALDLALEAGHRRLPVYQDSVENITGLITLREMIRVPEARRGALEVGVVARECLVVPEWKKIIDLLQEMQSSRTHLAVVVDEFGGTAGLVTVEDIAEELLGTISDEASVPPSVALPAGGWRVDGGLPVEDLAELIGGELPEGDWNTVAGLMMGLAGTLLELDDEVETAEHHLRVAAMRGRRITRIEVSPSPRAAPHS